MVPVVLLLICADGMRHGRRLALRIAITVQLAVTALAAVYLALFARIPQYPDRPRTGVMGSGFVHVLPLVVVPLRARGAARGQPPPVPRRNEPPGPPGPRRRGRRHLAGAGLRLHRRPGWPPAAWTRDGGLLGLAAELARQYLPLPIPGIYSRIFQGRNAVEAFLFAIPASSSGRWPWPPSGWSCSAGCTAPTPGRRTGTWPASLIRQGGDSLSWMALWEPNKYWFAPDGRGGVAYQQHGNVALTLAGPSARRRSARRPRRASSATAPSTPSFPCFYSCTDELWPMLQGRGFRRVAVAQETRLAVRELEFKGKEWQNVRTALNRAEKTGVSAVWGRYADFPPALRAQLGEVSEEWAAQKSVPEMGFTLGGIDELEDDEVLCCLAVDAEGQVQGVTSWLPVYADGRLVSWTLDFMRRRGDAFPGVMEFLIASAVLELRSSVEVISLSGSPLAKDAATVADAGRRREAGVRRGWPANPGRRGKGAGARVRVPFAGHFQVPFQARLPDAVPLLPGPAAAARHGPGAEPRLSARLVRAAKRTAAEDPGALIRRGHSHVRRRL